MALVVFASAFLAQWGESLESGDLLLSGSFTDPVAVGAGDAIVAEFGERGSVAVSLAG